MKVVALISGGKDSCMNMVLCRQYDHEVVALANLLPPLQDVDDMDSYMYQTVGHQVIAGYAQCMGLPLFRRRILGTSRDQRLVYEDTGGDEVEDLAALLAFVKREMPDVEAVSSGAIASDYQRTRVERVCSRLGLVSLAYLWHQPQAALLQRMIDTPIDAILVKVAAAGLRPEHHLGATLAAVSSKLHALRDTYGINVCGEGGEYETLTLDCPLFDHGRLVLDAWEAVTIADDAMAPVALLHPNSFHVEPKGTGPGGSLEATERWKVVEVADDFVAPTPPAPSKSEMSTEAGDWRAELRSIDGPVGVTLSATVQGCTSRCQTGEETIAALTSALQCIDAAMPAFSCSWGNAFFVHLYVPSMAHFAAANSAYARFLPAVNPPARATVQLAANASSALVVEVLLSRPQLGSLKKVLHVQSISEWAPSCIGPYSQAVTFRGLVHFAGQIPLDPPTMTVIQGDVAAQSVRSLKSCQAVAIAVGTDLEKAMLWCTVYTSGAAGRTGRAAAGEALDAFLLGHMQDPHAAPAENADTVGSSENGDDLDADDHVDSYLLAPQLTRHWDPVVTFVEVPELPRQVAVEIQPVAWVKDPEMEDPSSSSSDDDEEERRNRNARRRAQGAPELPAWVQKMESKKESYTLVRGRVQVASLFSPGSMLRACAAFSCVGNITTGALERAEDDILAFLQFALGDAQLRPTDVEAIKMYLTIASKDGMEQSVPQSLGMSFQEVYGLDPTVVPVLSIGLDASADAHLAVEIFARAI